MTERHQFVKWCRSYGACDPGIQYVKRFRTPQEWWAKGYIPWYMAWVVAKAKPDGYRFTTCHEYVITCYHFQYLAFPLYNGPSCDQIRKVYPRIPSYL